MTMRERRLGNSLNAVLIVAWGLSLGGCALSPFDEDGTFRQVTTAVGATGQLQEPAPFVKEKRPDELEYQPVGVTPTRPTDARRGSAVQDLEKELRSRQATSVQNANRPVPKSPYDGKIEPGFKPPPPAPLPEGTAPSIELGRAKPATSTAAPRAGRKNKPTEEADH